MKRILIIFGVLFILLIPFTSCLNDNNDRKPFYYFYDEPVMIIQLETNPFIRNETYCFSVPELSNDATLKVGDLLWTSFIVDVDNMQNQMKTGTTPFPTVTQFQYKKVDSAKVIIPADVDEFNAYMSDDYTAPIELATLYKYSIDNLLFFGFRHNDNLNQMSYIYELILNPVIEQGGNNYPTLYIRAKQVNESNSSKAHSIDGNLIFAFDATDFAFYYMESISPTSGASKFNLKYKTGIDSQGNDIYKAFLSNPISWKFVTWIPD